MTLEDLVLEDTPSEQQPRLRTRLKQYAVSNFVDATVICATGNLAFTAIELFGKNTTITESLHNRAGVYGLSLLGTIWLFRKGREKSREVFNASIDKTVKQFAHDAVYGPVFAGIMSPIIYRGISHLSWDQVEYLTKAAMLINFPLGIVTGVTGNIGRALAFDEKTRYLSERVSRLPKPKKLALLAGMVGTMVAADAAMYYVAYKNEARPVAAAYK